jgi:NAD(P)H-dependent FMN reductase
MGYVTKDDVTEAIIELTAEPDEANEVVDANDIYDAVDDTPGQVVANELMALVNPQALFAAGVQLGALAAFVAEDRIDDEYEKEVEEIEELIEKTKKEFYEAAEEAADRLERQSDEAEERLVRDILAADPGPEEDKPAVDESLPNVSEWNDGLPEAEGISISGFGDPLDSPAISREFSFRFKH